MMIDDSGAIGKKGRCVRLAAGRQTERLAAAAASVVCVCVCLLTVERSGKGERGI